VTTELELVGDSPVDIGVQDFCENCRLCEKNCPAQAITDKKDVIRGYRKWPQDHKKCLLFWFKGENTGGCTLCLKVCPWNKPATLVHKVSFFAAARSVVARRVLYWMAVIFYGEKTKWKFIPRKGELKLPPETESWAR
jgi:epoxyqueuosine reductase QueG